MQDEEPNSSTNLKAFAEDLCQQTKHKQRHHICTPQASLNPPHSPWQMLLCSECNVSALKIE